MNEIQFLTGGFRDLTFGELFSPVWKSYHDLFAVGFTSDLQLWNDITFSELILDEARFTGDFSYFPDLVRDAKHIIETLEPEYEIKIGLQGFLFFIGPNFFVVLSPILGLGRRQGSRFLSEVLEELSD